MFICLAVDVFCDWYDMSNNNPVSFVCENSRKAVWKFTNYLEMCAEKSCWIHSYPQIISSYRDFKQYVDKKR